MKGGNPVIVVELVAASGEVARDGIAHLVVVKLDEQGIKLGRFDDGIHVLILKNQRALGGSGDDIVRPEREKRTQLVDEGNISLLEDRRFDVKVKTVDRHVDAVEVKGSRSGVGRVVRSEGSPQEFGETPAVLLGGDIVAATSKPSTSHREEDSLSQVLASLDIRCNRLAVRLQ